MQLDQSFPFYGGVGNNPSNRDAYIRYNLTRYVFPGRDCSLRAARRRPNLVTIATSHHPALSPNDRAGFGEPTGTSCAAGSAKRMGITMDQAAAFFEKVAPGLLASLMKRKK
jgi:hypothetical protein